MYPFVIDAKILGTKKHLRCVGDISSWVDKVLVSDYHLSGNEKHGKCLDTLLHLGCQSLDLLPSKNFVKAMSFVTQREDIPWQKIMPSKTHEVFVKSVLDQITVAMVKLPFSYQMTTWEQGNGVLNSLCDIHVDIDEYNKIIASGDGNIGALNSFKPIDSLGTVKKPKYDRFGTRTGRMTIKKGAQILTLKKEHRKMLRSKFGDEGCIVSLDFAALEVRVMLYEAGNSFDDVDLYGSIARDHFGGTIERNVVKKAMIAEIYGQKKHTLGRALGISGKQLDDFIGRSRELFKIDVIKNKIKKEFINNCHITNKYGRCILINEPIDKIFINSYAQSTGVDVSLLGFKQIVDATKNDNDIEPIAMIHDAMLFDCKKSKVNRLREFDKVVVDGYKQPFILKLELV